MTSGIRILFATNPGKSRDSAGVLPTSRASRVTAAAVSSDVSSPRITSTSPISGTGLKKCMPTTRSGRPVAAPSRVIGMEEVLEARTPASGKSASASRNTASFAAASSTIASIIRSAETSSPAGCMRARTSSGSCGAPFAASFARLRPIPARPCSTAPGAASTSVTRRPEAATTCAIPAPIWPAPTTRHVLERHGQAYWGAERRSGREPEPRRLLRRPRSGSRRPGRHPSRSQRGRAPRRSGAARTSRSSRAGRRKLRSDARARRRRRSR